MPKLSDIARLLGVEMSSPDRELNRIATLDDASEADIAYITSDRYLDRVAKTKAGLIIASEALALPATPASVVIKVKDAELAMAGVLELFAPPAARPDTGIHPSAVIHPAATIGENASIGPHVYVAAGATIGNNVILHPGVVIGEHVIIGDDCEFFPNVVLRERIRLGSRVVIHANSTIGTDGFGYRWDGKRHAKIPQIGTVVIDDDVEIGSNTCIDRAKFGETRIGVGTKIDNLVQVGHNVRTGAHCILCGGVALAGSATLGNGVIMGGRSAATNHVHLADGTTLAAFAGVGGDTSKGDTLAGQPAIPHRDWLRERVAVQRLPELVKAVKRLEAELAKLKGN